MTRDSDNKTRGKAVKTREKVSHKPVKKASKKTRKKSKKRRAHGSVGQSLRAVLPFLPIFGPPLATAFIYMWLYTHMNIVSIPARDLLKQKENLQKENDSIWLRVEELQSLGRIERIAKTKLGMISPQDYRLVALDEPMKPPDDFPARPGPVESGPQTSTGSKDAPGSFKVGSADSVRQPG